MLRRFSLTQDPEKWSGDIVEDAGGSWVRWRDVVDYIAYAEHHGYTPPPEPEESAPLPEPMVERDILPEDFMEDGEDDFLLTADNDEDVYEYMVGKQPYQDEKDD